jgi:hypothetical protein
MAWVSWIDEKTMKPVRPISLKCKDIKKMQIDGNTIDIPVQ